MRSNRHYRGAFTLDGVLDSRGHFHVTEVNSRYGTALHLLVGDVLGYTLYVLSCLLVDGELEELDVRELERVVVDATRHSRTYRMSIAGSGVLEHSHRPA